MPTRSSNPELDGGMFAVLSRLAAGWEKYQIDKVMNSTLDEFTSTSREAVIASAFGRSKE